MPGLSWTRRLSALAGCLPLCAIEVAMVARLYAPSLPQGSLGRRLRVTVAVGVVLLVVPAVLMFTGLPGRG